MPLTPFHLGPALLLGALWHRRLDVPTLLVGSVIVDFRAALVVFGPLAGPVHGIFTTFFGGTAVALALAGAVRTLPLTVHAYLAYGRLAQTNHTAEVVAGALVGVYSHVVLDSLLYPDAQPFFPAEVNPLLLDGVKYIPVYSGCIVAGCLGLGLVAVRATRLR